MKNRDEIIKILQVVRNTTSDIEKQADRICNLFDVSYSVFDHETIQSVRNSSSDAEVRRMIKTKIKKL
jgi:hypothetical protein|tara:strand:- start:70 stop:273 length:204 start_codon:yes stop_codon:yes gene_type:complete